MMRETIVNEIIVEYIGGGYLVKVSELCEPILRTDHLVAEAARVAPLLGVEPRKIVAAVIRCIDDEVEAILNDPNPLEKLESYLDEVVAGEDMNKLLLFTLLLSGKVKDPEYCEMILLKSDSGAGKSTLQPPLLP